ncbi:hypothetical protein V5O48_014965 [Marasmius crinis-equi]|uniref:Ubiquitin-like protease family profile domain-containing protein n=1 Tax=Marasmius crinis-equi TaxID=585013 RepID=A0ABR3EVV3_9AGAR
MNDTCYGIFHTFTHSDTITNQDDKEIRATLSRIIIFWKKRMLDSDFNLFTSIDTDMEEDLPNVKTVSGFLEFLSLYNVIVLGSILWEEKHSKGNEMDQEVLELYKEAEDSAEVILKFLDDSMRIELVHLVDASTRQVVNQDNADPLPPGLTRIYQIRNRYLLHQVRSLYTALKRKGDKSRAVAFDKAILRDLDRFPPDIRKDLRSGIGKELENASYNWPGRYRTDRLQLAIVRTPAGGSPVITPDQSDDPYSDIRMVARCKAETGSPFQQSDPSSSGLRSLIDSKDGQACNQDPPPPPYSEQEDIGRRTVAEAAKEKGIAGDGHEGGDKTGVDVDGIESKSMASTGTREPSSRNKGGPGRGPRWFPRMKAAYYTYEQKVEWMKAQKKRAVEHSSESEGEIGEYEESEKSEREYRHHTSSPDVQMEDEQDRAASSFHVDSGVVDVTGAGAGGGPEVRDEASMDVDEADTGSAPHKRPRDAIHGAEDVAQKGTGKRRKLTVLDPPPRDLNFDPAKDPWFKNKQLPPMQGDWNAPARVILRRNAASSRRDDNIKILSGDLKAFVRPSDTESWLNDSDIIFASWALRYLYPAPNIAIFYPGIFDPTPRFTTYRNSRCEEFWAKDTWLIPYNIVGNHWAIAIVKAKTRQVLLFDSLAMVDDLNRWIPVSTRAAILCVNPQHTPSSQTIKSRSEQLINEAQADGKAVQFESLLSLSTWSYHQLKMTKTQSNGKDCGVWILWVISAVLRGFDYAELEEGSIDEFRGFCAKAIRIVPVAVDHSPVAHVERNCHDMPIPSLPATTSGEVNADYGFSGKSDLEATDQSRAGNTTALSAFNSPEGRLAVQPVTTDASSAFSTAPLPPPIAEATHPPAEPPQSSDPPAVAHFKPAPVPRHSLYLADPVLSAEPEAGSGQSSSQTWQEYFAKRDEQNLLIASKESPEAKRKRERQAEEDMRKVTLKNVYYWDERGEERFRVRCLLQKRDHGSYIDQYTGGRRKYDSFTRDWDLCTEFGDPDPRCATDSDFDE